MQLMSPRQERNDESVGHSAGIPWIISYALVVGVGLFIGAAAYRRPGQLYFGLCLALLIVLIAAWVRFPRAALAGTVFLTLVGDSVTAPWFPFTKNFSSWESLFYVSPALTFSPLDVTLVAGLVTSVWRSANDTGRVLRTTNSLLRPMLLFAGLCLIGLVAGLSRAGDLRVAIFEIRPLIYLPTMFLLFVQVCRNTRDYTLMLSAAIVAIVVQSTISIRYLYELAPEQREVLEALGQHGSAIGMNLVLVVLLFSILTPNIPRWIPTALIVALVPVSWAYIVSQRRAAVVALAAAFAVIAFCLWWRRRRMFWLFVPVVVVLAVGYVAAFWNVDSGVGFPAQAIKNVISPGSMSAKDQSSNLYRDAENYNLWATILADPWVGQGFGRPFLRPFSLPDISRFEFHEFIPHNSLLWIWIRTGFVGFVALLYIFARALTLGVDRYRRTRAGVEAVTVGTALTFVVMFAVFLYVDIAWEPRNVLLLAMSFGLLTATFGRGTRLRPESDADASDTGSGGDVVAVSGPVPPTRN